MSALPPEADMLIVGINVCKVPGTNNLQAPALAFAKTGLLEVNPG